VSGPEIEALEKGLAASEIQLLRELICALRTLHYGSVNLIVHDGRLVEVQKVERIRVNSARAKG